MKKFLYFLLISVSPLLADTTFTGCDATCDQYFSLTGPSDDWYLAHHSTGDNGEAVAEFLKQGDTLDVWNEMVTIMYLPFAPDMPGSRLVYTMVSQLKQLCRRADWCFIEKGRHDITYEWYVSRASGHLDVQHEIVRFIQHGDGWFRVSYTKKVPKLEEGERDAWIAALLAAEPTPFAENPSNS